MSHTHVDQNAGSDPLICEFTENCNFGLRSEFTFMTIFRGRRREATYSSEV